MKSATAVLLYPSLCLLEGTDVSVGRGTDIPFEVWGHPSFKKMSYTFTPVSKAGAKSPPHLNIMCYGKNLHMSPEEAVHVLDKKINIGYLQQALMQTKDTSKFFNSFFDKLAGNHILQQQLAAKKSEADIRKSWQPALAQFKKIRKKYLLYEDFE